MRLILRLYLFDINGGRSNYRDYPQPCKRPFDLAEWIHKMGNKERKGVVIAQGGEEEGSSVWWSQKADLGAHRPTNQFVIPSFYKHWAWKVLVCLFIPLAFIFNINKVQGMAWNEIAVVPCVKSMSPSFVLPLSSLVKISLGFLNVLHSSGSSLKAKYIFNFLSQQGKVLRKTLIFKDF